MPELPEVETVARQLAPLLCGRTIQRVAVIDAKLVAPWWPGLRGASVSQVTRLGKQVVIALEPTPKPPCWLAVHLRMTGRLVYEPEGGRTPPAGRGHLRLWLSLDRGALALYDPRRFATTTLARDMAELTPRAVDPVTPAFTRAKLAQLLAGSPQPLKLWLLRQDKLVGLGNIYVSEILFAARLHPERAAGSLAAAEVAALHRETRRILKAAIRHCGTTFSDFQDAHGRTGDYARFLKVYQRGGQPCPICGTVLERFVQGQRSTFYCPGCQPAP